MKRYKTNSFCLYDPPLGRTTCSRSDHSKVSVVRANSVSIKILLNNAQLSVHVTSLLTKWFWFSEFRKLPGHTSVLVHHTSQDARKPLGLIKVWLILLCSLLTHQEHNEYINLRGATKSSQLIRTNSDRSLSHWGRYSSSRRFCLWLSLLVQGRASITFHMRWTNRLIAGVNC